MHTVKASEFKARCLALMDDVARTGEPILITKNGKPVAELRQVAKPISSDLMGLMKNRIRIVGDIISPIGEDDWDVLK